MAGFALLWLLVPGAVASVSHNVSNVCSAPSGVSAAQHSLMQRQTKSFQIDKFSIDNRQHTGHEALVGFESYANELTARVVDHNTNLSANDLAAINVVLTFIDSMNDNLVTEHEEDTAEVERCNTQLSWCKSRLNHSLDLHNSSAANVSRARHSACREREKRINISVIKECRNYTTYRQKNNGALLPSCVASDLLNDNITTVNKQEQNAMEACLELVKAWLDPLYERYTACDDENNTLQATRTTCNEEQNVFEDKYCLYATAHAQSCDSFNTCWSQEVSLCQQTCSEVAHSVSARKADNETATKIKCLLAVLTSENENKSSLLAACNAATPDSLADWNISCPNRSGPWPAPPEPVFNCTPLAQPNQAAWIEKEYESQDWYGHVTMAPVQKCNTPPEVVAGLIAFYPLDQNCYDVVGNYSAEKVGAVTFGEDGVKAAHFTTSSYCKVDAFKNHLWGSSFSVCTWAKRSGRPMSYMGIVGTGFYNQGAWEIRVGREGCNGGTCTMLGGGVVTQQHDETWDVKGVEMPMHTWVHICMTYDGRRLEYYTDKVLRVTSENDSGDMKVVGLPLVIGTSQPGHGESFEGDIARVRIYSRVLTESDVAAIYDQEALTVI